MNLGFKQYFIQRLTETFGNELYLCMIRMYLAHPKTYPHLRNVYSEKHLEHFAKIATERLGYTGNADFDSIHEFINEYFNSKERAAISQMLNDYNQSGGTLDVDMRGSYIDRPLRYFVTD